MKSGRADRAKQFMSFDSLDGLREMLEETEKEIERGKEFSFAEADKRLGRERARDIKGEEEI